MGYKNKYIWNSEKSQFEEQFNKEEDFDYDQYFKQKREKEKEDEERKILNEKYVEFVCNIFVKFSYVLIILLILLFMYYILTFENF